MQKRVLRYAQDDKLELRAIFRADSSTAPVACGATGFAQDDISSYCKRLLHGRFHLDRAREQDVVLPVYVLVKVLLEVAKAIIERVIGGACPFGRGVLIAPGAQRFQQHAGVVVLLGHHRDGIRHSTEAALRPG